MTFTFLSRSQVRVSFRNRSVSKGHGSDAETTTDTFGNPGVWLSGVVLDVVVVVGRLDIVGLVVVMMGSLFVVVVDVELVVVVVVDGSLGVVVVVIVLVAVEVDVVVVVTVVVEVVGVVLDGKPAIID